MESLMRKRLSGRGGVAGEEEGPRERGGAGSRAPRGNSCHMQVLWGEFFVEKGSFSAPARGQ
jgi:hypothetical protein